MKKITNYLLNQLKYFFVNQFWTSFPVIIILILSIVLNGIIWFQYIEKYREVINSTPIIYSSAVFILNLFLAAISYPKEKLISWVLISIALLIQVFILFFVKTVFLTGIS